MKSLNFMSKNLFSTLKIPFIVISFFLSLSLLIGLVSYLPKDSRSATIHPTNIHLPRRGKFFECDIHYINFFPGWEDFRHFCVPESTCRSNPDLRICYHHTEFGNIKNIKNFLTNSGCENILFKVLDVPGLLRRHNMKMPVNTSWEKIKTERNVVDVVEFSDIIRYLILKDYKGLYLDTDEGAVKNITKFFLHGKDVIFYQHKNINSIPTQINNTPLLILKNSKFLQELFNIAYRKYYNYENIDEWARLGAISIYDIFQKLKRDLWSEELIFEHERVANSIGFLYHSWIGERNISKCINYNEFWDEGHFVHFYNYCKMIEHVKGSCFHKMIERICPASLRAYEKFAFSRKRRFVY